MSFENLELERVGKVDQSGALAPNLLVDARDCSFDDLPASETPYLDRVVESIVVAINPVADFGR